MDALIYTAMSGADRALRAQQVHANNLANIEMAAFAPTWKCPLHSRCKTAMATTTAT